MSRQAGDWRDRRGKGEALKRGSIVTALRAIAGIGLAFALAGCGGGDDGASGGDNGGSSGLEGRIRADGSSTVGPFASAAAERFRQVHPDVRITVGISGTGGGFERFCRGETDLSNASRPIKEDEEVPLCKKNNVQPIRFVVANDALSVVVNPENDWVDCLTVGELNKIWRPEAKGKVTSWNQIRPSFPDEPLELAGAGTDSGTFDYFTEAINGDTGVIRPDYTPSENDNVIVQAVSGQKGAMGFVGFSYVEENQDKMKPIAVDGGGGCVKPSVATVQDQTYKPLGRPLYIYAKKESFERPEVEKFIRYMVDNEAMIAESSLFIPLTDEQIAVARKQLEDAVAR